MVLTAVVHGRGSCTVRYVTSVGSFIRTHRAVRIADGVLELVLWALTAGGGTGISLVSGSAYCNTNYVIYHGLSTIVYGADKV